MNKNKRGFAFSLVQILVVLAVLGTGGAANFGVITWRPSARHEAERAMSWLYGILARADNNGMSFVLKLNSSGLASGLIADWGNNGVNVETWNAGEGCKLNRVPVGTSKVIYSPQWGTFTPALTVKFTGGGGDVHYLIISGQGRLRISEKPSTD